MTELILFKNEAEAVVQVIRAGEQFGFGNLISHLQTAWAMFLMQNYQIPERDARFMASGDEKGGYPLSLHQEVMRRGLSNVRT